MRGKQYPCQDLQLQISLESSACFFDARTNKSYLYFKNLEESNSTVLWMDQGTALCSAKFATIIHTYLGTNIPDVSLGYALTIARESDLDEKSYEPTQMS